MRVGVPSRAAKGQEGIGSSLAEVPFFSVRNKERENEDLYWRKASPL